MGVEGDGNDESASTTGVAEGNAQQAGIGRSVLPNVGNCGKTSACGPLGIASDRKRRQHKGSWPVHRILRPGWQAVAMASTDGPNRIKWRPRGRRCAGVVERR